MTEVLVLPSNGASDFKSNVLHSNIVKAYNDIVSGILGISEQ